MADLFERCDLGGIDVNNRFIRSATCENMANEKGHLNEKLLNVYEELAQGELGLIITGYANVIDSDRPSRLMMGIYDDSFVPEYQKLTDAVHRNGSKVVMQLVAGGSQTENVFENQTIWGPSAVEDKFSRITPKEMSSQDIETLIDSFANAALRCKQAGFDGVQIHSAHGYLLSKFLSPYYNERKDEYGSCIENRARIVYRVYQKIRDAVGSHYPVFIKINCDDFMEDGFDFEECKIVCVKLDEIGINAIEVSGGSASSRRNESPARIRMKKPEHESYFLDYASQIASLCTCDVILVGGNRTTAVMQDILEKTKIKFFSLSRPLIAEPDLIKKWNVNPHLKPLCTSCNKCFNKSGSVCIQNK